MNGSLRLGAGHFLFWGPILNPPRIVLQGSDRVPFLTASNALMISSSAPSETLLVLDSALNVRAANKAFYAMFRLAPAECVGRKVYELGGRAWDEKLRPMLEAVLKGEPSRTILSWSTMRRRVAVVSCGLVPVWSHRRIPMNTPFSSRSKI